MFSSNQVSLQISKLPILSKKRRVLRAISHISLSVMKLSAFAIYYFKGQMTTK